jgi:hypothetical protein
VCTATDVCAPALGASSTGARHAECPHLGVRDGHVRHAAVGQRVARAELRRRVEATRKARVVKVDGDVVELQRAVDPGARQEPRAAAAGGRPRPGRRHQLARVSGSAPARASAASSARRRVARCGQGARCVQTRAGPAAAVRRCLARRRGSRKACVCVARSPLVPHALARARASASEAPRVPGHNRAGAVADAQHAQHRVKKQACSAIQGLSGGMPVAGNALWRCVLDADARAAAAVGNGHSCPTHSALLCTTAACTGLPEIWAWHAPEIASSSSRGTMSVAMGSAGAGCARAVAVTQAAAVELGEENAGRQGWCGRCS